MNEILSFINRKINIINTRIENEFDDAKDNRGYVSQNIIKNLRDFIEYISFKIYIIEDVKAYIEYNHENNKKAIKYIKSKTKHEILRKFHALLELGPSHNSYNEDGSTRLMVKYQEYLIELKRYYYKMFGDKILKNLYKFPIYNIEPSLVDYYKSIYNIIDINDGDDKPPLLKNPYYIMKEKPIVFNDKLFYELTLTPATDYINKFNRNIFYSLVKIPSNYAVKISYVKKNIVLFDELVTVNIIIDYEVFIKPAEISSLYKIFGIDKNVSARANEYEYFMKYLKENKCTLLDIVKLSDIDFEFLEMGTNIFNTHNILELIKLIRSIVLKNLPGSNVIKYFIHRLRNSVITKQLSVNPCNVLSNLYLGYGCNIFEKMPYASSLNEHNISINELVEIIEPYNREHELFYRQIKNICDTNNRVFIPFNELGKTEEECKKLVTEFNSKVYYKHLDRQLKIISGNVYISGYADSTIRIIQKLRMKKTEKNEEYGSLYSSFKFIDDYVFSDSLKEEISETIYKDSKIGLIYGSAGTGKTEMIKIISRIFGNKDIAFLSKTNAAVNNIKIRVKDNIFYDNYYFSTVDSFIGNRKYFDLIIIDECSMIENDVILKLLEKSNYDCLLLVGDIYQIEAIEFGNWFYFAKFFVKDASYELSENYRTTNYGLRKLWSKVRNIEEGITEKIIDEEYQSEINETIFKKKHTDEIVLCLNYDGPYGINSINKYLQLKNHNKAIEWGVNVYKKDDPVIFSGNSKFSDVLYNNLKGVIVDIKRTEKEIRFQVFVEKMITEHDVMFCNLKIIEYTQKGTIIEFIVVSKEDEDTEDKLDYVVPFTISYASSIHKAQGLEYDSVKIIISNESEEQITKNIFYTAITRTKNNLKIFWRPECQDKILKNLSDSDFKKDICIIKGML